MKTPLRISFEPIARTSRGAARWLGLNLQILKMAFAASTAWWVALHVVHNPFPYFAPLGAILTVQVTVFDSVVRGLYRIAGVILGCFIGLIAMHWFTLNTLSIFIVLWIGLTVSSALRLHTAITSQVGVTTLLVMVLHKPGYASARVLETLIGCAIGVIVELSIKPGHHHRIALSKLAEELRRVIRALRAGKSM